MKFEEWWKENNERKQPGFQDAIKYFAEQAWSAALEEAAKIAESNIMAPATQWGNGAAYNAGKIAKAIRAL